MSKVNRRHINNNIRMNESGFQTPTMGFTTLPSGHCCPRRYLTNGLADFDGKIGKELGSCGLRQTVPAIDQTCGRSSAQSGIIQGAPALTLIHLHAHTNSGESLPSLEDLEVTDSFSSFCSI